MSYFDKLFNGIHTRNQSELSNPIEQKKRAKEIFKAVPKNHGIKLMNHTIKHWESVTEHRLRYETTILENQFDFILRWSTMEGIILHT